MSHTPRRFELPLEGPKLKQEVLDEIVRRVVEVAQPEPQARGLRLEARG